MSALERLASPDGVFCMLALDHRDALRNAFRRAGAEEVSAETMLELKRRIATALGADASGILLDHGAAGCRPDHAGLLVPLEAQGYEPIEGARLNALEFDSADARSSSTARTRAASEPTAASSSSGTAPTTARPRPARASSWLGQPRTATGTI